MAGCALVTAKSRHAGLAPALARRRVTVGAVGAQRLQAAARRAAVTAGRQVEEAVGALGALGADHVGRTLALARHVVAPVAVN